MGSLSLHHVARLVVIWLADAGTLQGDGVRHEYRLASQKPSRTRHRRVGALTTTIRKNRAQLYSAGREGIAKVRSLNEMETCSAEA